MMRSQSQILAQIRLKDVAVPIRVALFSVMHYRKRANAEEFVAVGGRESKWEQPLKQSATSYPFPSIIKEPLSQNRAGLAIRHKGHLPVG